MQCMSWRHRAPTVAMQPAPFSYWLSVPRAARLYVRAQPGLRSPGQGVEAGTRWVRHGFVRGRVLDFAARPARAVFTMSTTNVTLLALGWLDGLIGIAPSTFDWRRTREAG
jgi:hypothetical protein